MNVTSEQEANINMMMKISTDPLFAERSPGGQNILAHAILIIQLVLLVALSRLYEVESSLHLADLILVATLGYVVHIFLPARFNLHFFLVLGWSGLIYFLGWVDALLGIGYGLILFTALTYIVNFKLRMGTVVVIIAIPISLLAQKNGWALMHINAFSLFGSMTIYRLLLFIYDKTYQKTNPGLIQDLSYFFMLPNMALTLFPAVDYTQWTRNYLDERAILIQKKGVQWMVLGLFHLILYRIIYSYLVLPLSGVEDLHTFIWHATSTYTLILRLSGIFHLAAGTLCLFGYNMPPVFNNYFLASGFSDIWRRLNMYFRDFMVKIFYYPVYFKIRHLGNQPATVLAILCMFIISWMLHSYQWFWFKGTFPLKWVDLIFWNTWGVLVAASVFLPKNLWRAQADRHPWISSLLNTTKIMATFLTMSLLWSLWSVNTLPEWTRIVSLATRSPFEQYVQVTLGLGFILAIGTFLYRLAVHYRWASFFNPPFASRLASVWSFTMISGLLFLQIPAIHRQIGRSLKFDMAGLLTPRLSSEDAELQVDGYYTELLFDNLTSPLASMKTPGGKQFQHTEGARTIPGFRYLAMRPITSFEFKGKPFTINRWGFRDQDYTLTPGPNTTRTLFMGGSFVAGSGVADNEVVDVLLEERMNALPGTDTFEFLNLGCPHYDLLECVLQFEEDHLEKFKPRYLFYFSHGKDLHRNNKDILKAFNQDYQLPFAFLEEAIRESGIQKGMTDQEILDRLSPHGEYILEQTYRELKRQCQDNRIIPVWVYWPTVDTRGSQIEAKNAVRKIVERLGFIILDLEHLYDGVDKGDMKISEEDIHPSVLNHQMTADTLFQFIQTELRSSAR